jgi:hypothetical protein
MRSPHLTRHDFLAGGICYRIFDRLRPIETYKSMQIL